MVCVTTEKFKWSLSWSWVYRDFLKHLGMSRLLLLPDLLLQNALKFKVLIYFNLHLICRLRIFFFGGGVGKEEEKMQTKNPDKQTKETILQKL